MSESFKRWLLKRRRLAVFVLIICIIFLVYQILSLKSLNVQMSHHLTQTVGKDFLPTNLVNNKLKQNYLNQIETNLDLNEKSEQNYDKNVRNEKRFSIFGVLNQLTQFYRKINGSFQCLQSREYIPYEYINDDYCDCVDGSDEPSTNACPNNRFYCRSDSGKSDDYISSAKVNDGICDCCDGSDEYKGLSTPVKLTQSQIDTIKSSKRLVWTPPCPNFCHLY